MDAVEDIKSRLAIEDVIGRYVELKRAGRNFRGLSPFSSEKTPSFMVSPEKQIWHDFSSGKGGNMFSFVMEMEGLDFKGALEMLARQAGVDLSQYRTGYDAERGKQKERLYEASELAAKFYQIHFSKTPAAYEYILKKRGYSKQTALDFRIGYSPSGDAELSKFLIKKGFTEQELQRAGLASKRYRDLRDMFRGRIMVPLMDPQGRVIGFTARLLEDAPNAPKYINTPQTPLYDKSRHVFGLHLAKEAIRRHGYAVVVEGNLDVIASHQAGVKQTVASAGTAMTEQHLKILGRFTHDVRLAFDQDNAGLQAAERVIPLASKADISLSIITVPGSKDPDELIQKDPKAWEKVIQEPQYALDWLIERYQKQLNLNSAVGKRQFSDILLKVIKGLTDSVEQDHYITEIAQLIGVSPDALRDKLKNTSGERKIMRKTAEQPKLNPLRVEQVKIQNQLMALLLVAAQTRQETTATTKVMLPEKPAQDLFDFLKKHPEFNIRKDQKKIPPDTSDYMKILLLLYEQLYQGLETLELRYEAARLQARLIDHYVKVKKGELSARMRSASESQMADLLKEAKDLDLLLRSTKEAISG